MARSATLPISDRSELKAAIRGYIIENFLFGDDTGVGDLDSLVDAGILDSTGVMELVAHLEENFEIEVQDQDLIPENLDSIENIARFVHNRLKSSVAIDG